MSCRAVLAVLVKLVSSMVYWVSQRLECVARPEVRCASVLSLSSLLLNLFEISGACRFARPSVCMLLLLLNAACVFLLSWRCLGVISCSNSLQLITSISQSLNFDVLRLRMVHVYDTYRREMHPDHETLKDAQLDANEYSPV